MRKTLRDTKHNHTYTINVCVEEDIEEYPGYKVLIDEKFIVKTCYYPSIRQTYDSPAEPSTWSILDVLYADTKQPIEPDIWDYFEDEIEDALNSEIERYSKQYMDYTEQELYG